MVFNKSGCCFDFDKGWGSALPETALLFSVTFQTEHF